MENVRHYTFLGTIHPSEGAAGLSYVGDLHIGFGDDILPTQGRVVIKRSTIRARVSVDATVPLEMVANNLRGSLAVLVDAQGFLDGYGRTVELVSARDLESKRDYSFGGGVPGLRQGWVEPKLTLDQVLEAAHRDQRLADALGDFRHAIAEPWDTGFYCYRAVEMVMRHWLELDGQSKDQAWSAMRAALHVSRSELEPLRPWANLQRHGARRTITSEDHTALLRITRAVLESMCRHLLGTESHRECSVCRDDEDSSH